MKANLYRFGLKAGMCALFEGHFAAGLKRIAYPVPYWRRPVFEWTLQNVELRANSQVLDIASPKLLALWMAVRLPVQVHATDLQDPNIHTLWQTYYDSFPARSRKGRLTTRFEDARGLNYPDSTFDFIYSISVLEHIPGDGDSKAMREIFRTLKPGGRALIEVPYALRYCEDYLAEDVYDRRYAGEPVFYQRHYDDQNLESRLVAPSGLAVERRAVFGERFPFERIWLRVPAVARMPFLWTEYLISRLNLKEVTGINLQEQREMHRRRAMDAILLMRKP